jgi:alpha-glucoside transport system permease protein
MSVVEVRSRRRRAARVVGQLGSGAVQVGLAAVALLWMVPVLGLLVVSLRPRSASLSSGWWRALARPSELTLENYRALLADDVLRESLWNTMNIALPATLLVVLIAAPAGYTLAWIDFPGRDWLTLAVVALLVIPFQVALIPMAQLYGAIGLYGTITGVVLYHVAFGLPFAIFLLRNFFATLPADLLEAARLDGAKEWRVFRRVVLPLSSSAIASVAIFEFVWVWNDFLVALVFSDSDSEPIAVTLRQEVQQFSTNVDVLAAGSFVSMLVPLLVFFSLQRHFVQGVLAGSTK